MSKSIRGGKGYGSDLGFLPQETSFRTSTLLISHRYDFIHSNLSILARYTKIAGFRIGQAAKKGEEWARVSKRVTLHIYCFMHLAWLKMLWQKLWWWWRYIPLSNDDDDDESNDEEEVAPYRAHQSAPGLSSSILVTPAHPAWPAQYLNILIVQYPNTPILQYPVIQSAHNITPAHPAWPALNISISWPDSSRTQYHNITPAHPDWPVHNISISQYLQGDPKKTSHSVL